MDNQEFVKQEDARRLVVLQKIYAATIVVGKSDMMLGKDIKDHQISEGQLHNIIQYFKEKGLVEVLRERPGAGYLLRLTYPGINEVETIIKHPHQPTAYFGSPFIQNIFNAPSNVQQGHDQAFNIHPPVDPDKQE